MLVVFPDHLIEQRRDVVLASFGIYRGSAYVLKRARKFFFSLSLSLPRYFGLSGRVAAAEAA